MPARRALLVGINAYPHVPPLNGCVNDVHLMREVLVEQFGFPPDHIALLADAEATRDRILAAFDALVSATGADDIVVFHFAGHGSQIADREGDEPSGFDSTLVPFDAMRPVGDVPDITDDEIHLRLEQLAEKTSFTTVIVDACHSGTVTRDDFGERGRSIDADTRTASELPASPIPEERRRRSRALGPSGWMPLTDKYVLIAGCRDEEQSYEYRPREGRGKVAHGALTYFLCQQLRRATPGVSYRDVFEHAAALVNAENDLQHPQMEGRSDREVFGVADFVPAAFVRITEREDEVVLLAAGAAHGVTVGSTYRVGPQGARDAEAADILGLVQVAEVQAVTAIARIVSEAAPGRIAPGARAFEGAHAYGDQRLTAAFAVSDNADGHVAALRARLEQSALVTLTAGEAAASARIYRLEPRTAVSAASPVPQVGALAEPRWAVVGVTGDLLMPLKRLDEGDAIARNLERLAKYRHALAIENPDPRSQLRGRFTVRVQRFNLEKKGWDETNPPTDGGQIVLYAGDIVRILVRSAHDAPVYISLYDFGLSGAISQIYPAKGAQEQLRANGVLECQAQRLTFPEPSPESDATSRASAIEGIETVKLFVTMQPTDFSGLEQESLRTEQTLSPLAALLTSVFNGRTMRDETPVSLGEEDWTTASISFVLRRSREA
jgi:hypothetical protein